MRWPRRPARPSPSASRRDRPAAPATAPGAAAVERGVVDITTTLATGEATLEGTGMVLSRALTVTDEAGHRPRRLSGLIEVTASLAPGDSGGPLLTRAGRVVGMNTAAAFSTQLGATSDTGYSIPIDQALGIARQIQAGRG